MLGVSLTGPYTLEPKEYSMPQIRNDNDVLFEILQTGICGSDLLAYRGKHKYVKFPVRLGHETVARVKETGKSVTKVKSGDLITVQPQVSCGHCYACRKGAINVCESKSIIGILQDGFFAEYFVCPDTNVIKLPDDFPVDKGMLVEPFAVGANAAEKAEAGPGKRMTVLGAGTIGNCVAQTLRAKGVEVLITDIIDEKLEFAKKCGIQHCINTKNIPLKEAINSAFNGQGCDAIIDCCAVTSYVNEIIEAASNSSLIVIVGTFEKPVDNIDLTRLQRREIHVHSVMQYLEKHYNTAIDLLKNDIYTEGFIGKRFKLIDMNKGFEYMDKNPSTLKIAIEMK